MAKVLSIFLSLFTTFAWAQNVDSLEVSMLEDSVEVEETRVQIEAQETETHSATLSFGYFSYSEVLHSMPEFENVKSNLENLTKQFQAEAERSEAEFNKKYETFLDEQKDLAPSISKKRQSELQDMMERNIAFKEEAQRLLLQAEKEAYAPLKEKISAALKKVGKEKELAFVLNTDNDAVPYIDTTIGIDINQLVKRELSGGRNK
jgi:outer membrane protein